MGKSPFTMPGSEFLGKGNQSPAVGKYTESPAKIMPSYINNEMVSDNEADEQDTLNQDLINARNKGILKPGVFDKNYGEVDRKGYSQIKNIKSEAKKSDSGKLDAIDQLMIKDEEEWIKTDEGKSEEEKSRVINLADIENRRKKAREIKDNEDN